LEVPSVGDIGLVILHGGEGGDVELGARTSKHIFALAFDPLSLNSLSLLFVQIIIHSFISYTLLVLCLAYFILLYISYMLGCLCASLVLNQQELHIAPQPISRRIKRS